MIKLTSACEILGPLMALFPRTDEDEGYLYMIAKALAEISSDEQQAREIVSHTMRSARYRPLPADFQDALRASGEHQPPPWTGTYTCECCQDIGWVAARGTKNTAERCPACIRRKAPGLPVTPAAKGAA